MALSQPSQVRRLFSSAGGSRPLQAVRCGPANRHGRCYGRPISWLFRHSPSTTPSSHVTTSHSDLLCLGLNENGVDGGNMARAAGIFLIFAAQRPEDRVMPLQLRDNLGNRLVLRVESARTSVISLGEEGAERLLGLGHLAAKLQGEERTILAQVPILTPEQMRDVVQSIPRDR